MNDKHYDFLVFIGRFQPFHKGHLTVIHEGLQQTKQLIILCGSAHQPRSTRNPWTITEREAMIRGAFSDEENQRIHIAPLMDMMYNEDAWVRNVQITVQGLVSAHHGLPHKQPNIGLLGHKKDHSSYYLKFFPQWGSVDVANVENINATAIRDAIFQLPVTHEINIDEHLKHTFDDVLPDNVRQQFNQFCETPAFKEIHDEYAFITKYKQAWQATPYPPTFVTVDAVVVQSGHILMVERKARPGKGLLALPGGFINNNELLVDACIRELKEEARLRIPVAVLKGAIKHSHVFDDPHRSARGRTITHVFYFALNPEHVLPKVKGGDDAKHAMWIPLAELDPHKLFEDHYFIIQKMLGT